MQEIKEAKEKWKKNHKMIADIIKFCFQTNLIESKLNGNKFQATIANNSPKVQEEMHLWDDQDKARYGITKTTTVLQFVTQMVLYLVKRKKSQQIKID